MPQRIKSRVLKRYLYPYVHRNILRSGQKVGVAQMSIDGRVDKQNVVHPHSGILLSLEKEGDSGHATAWMNLEDIIQSEQKDKYC